MRALKTAFKIWKKITGLAVRYPAVAAPFLVIILIDTVLLSVIQLSLSSIAPERVSEIVIKVAGINADTIPNYFLLSEIFNKLKNCIGFISIFFTGIAVSLAYKIEKFPEAGWLFGLQKAARKYFRLLGIWLLTAGIFLTLSSIIEYFLITNGYYYYIPGIDVLLAAAIHFPFLFTIPAILIENKKVVPAIYRSVYILNKNPGVSILLAAVPASILSLFVYFMTDSSFIMFTEAPHVITVRIVILAVIDFFMSLSAAQLLLITREKEAKYAKV